MKLVRYAFIFLLIVACIAGPLALIKGGQIRTLMAMGENQVMPPETVTAAPVAPQTWETSISATGTIAPVQGVTVAAEVGGKVTQIAFEAGANVKAGDLLVQLDTATEEAQLRAAEATAALAKANLQRAKDLRESNTNSVAELDAADAQAKQAAAQVDNLKGVIAKKTIRAPFAGRLGLRMINLGQVLREGDEITALQTLDPIYANFSVPQQRLARLEPGTPVRVQTDAAPNVTFDGKITAINAEVDPVTRNVRVQATLANKGEKLRSGMFANVDVILPEKQEVLAIPATAVLYAPFGDSVFVVEDRKDEKSGETKKVLRQQFIRIGLARGDFVAVVDGLKPGETVVTSGVFKLRGGMAVVIDNKLAPKAQLDPKPANT
ncbi:efflux RND transporter periplasmic adaptor subunit [Opitutus sp. ER46]|uniref:efflux RND transporter periplasmic adaptor subunit n=1 Tax=Opitutus sp. ER46 TaxID=2161864 RepID=UPI000D3284A2|nr:efflux RND transporter periplasmic adaptor subunit [Opitutus sp. ER46]PTX98997.1 efflux transporter periplasmic adaptor subunit [Opitutus sp. ER46]